MLTGITRYSVSMEKTTNTKYMAMTMAPYVLLSLKFCTKTATSWKQRLKRRKAPDTNSTPEKFIWKWEQTGSAPCQTWLAQSTFNASNVAKRQ